MCIYTYYKSPTREWCDRPILLRFDIPILLRRCRRRRLRDVDDDDLFLEDVAFVSDRTALCNLLTLGVFFFSADFSADFTFVFAALFARAVPCFSNWVPFLWIDEAILLPCFVASRLTNLLPLSATVCKPLDRISPIPDPTLLPPPIFRRRRRRRLPPISSLVRGSFHRRPYPRVVRMYG